MKKGYSNSAPAPGAVVVGIDEVRAEALGSLTEDELLLILYRRAEKYPNRILPVVCGLALALGKIHVIESYLEREKARLLGRLSDQDKERLKAIGAIIA